MITMVYITNLPRTSSGNVTIWVIVDRLTKSAFFLATRETDEIDVIGESQSIRPEIVVETVEKVATNKE